MHPEEKSLLLVGLELGPVLLPVGHQQHGREISAASGPGPESSALTSRPPATLVTSKLQLSCYFKQFRCHFFSNPSFISVCMQHEQTVCAYLNLHTQLT